jgi:hypothetical protein
MLGRRIYNLPEIAQDWGKTFLISPADPNDNIWFLSCPNQLVTIPGVSIVVGEFAKRLWKACKECLDKFKIIYNGQWI